MKKLNKNQAITAYGSLGLVLLICFTTSRTVIGGIICFVFTGVTIGIAICKILD